MTNEYGLDTDYHKGKLEILLRDIDRYKPDEFARTLLRLCVVAKPIILTEKEFVDARLKAIADVMHEKDKMRNAL